jgi:hypothetical protein
LARTKRKWVNGASVVLVCAGCTAPITKGVLAPDDVSAPSSPLTPITAGVELDREAFGPFTVVVEKDTVRFRGFHVPAGWTHVHLWFATPDETMYVALIDNGAALVIQAQTSAACHISSQYHQYRADEGGTHLYSALQYTLDEMVRICPRGMEEARRYQRLFRRSETEFGQAIQAMMTKAARMYNGTLVRCENPEDPHDENAWKELGRRCLGISYPF